MKRILFLLPLALALRAFADEDIKPPFGLIWGESSERLEKLLKNAKATVVEKRKAQNGRDAWDVEGLSQAGLKRTVFYFKAGTLCEVELQYQRENWDEAKYNEYMGQIRRSIEKRFGPGQIVARKTEPEGEVMQTVMGYKWNRNNTVIELFYYSAAQGTNVFRTLSVHYRAD